MGCLHDVNAELREDIINVKSQKEGMYVELDNVRADN